VGFDGGFGERGRHCGGNLSVRVGRGGGVGMARSDLNWWVRGLGANLGHLVANLRWIWWDLWHFWIDRQVWNVVFGLIWEWGGERSRLGSGDEMRWVGGEESANKGFKILCWLMRRGGRADGEN
jgi:hypothetical protein